MTVWCWNWWIWVIELLLYTMCPKNVHLFIFQITLCMRGFPLGVGSGEGAVPPPRKMFQFSEWKWRVLVRLNTVLRLMFLQQKASKPISVFTRTTCYTVLQPEDSRQQYSYMHEQHSSVSLGPTSHQMSMHCACKYFVKNRVCDTRSLRRMPTKYATGLTGVD